MKKILTIIVLYLSTISTLFADDRNVELDKLFLELKKNIPSLSSGIAQQIWMLWSTHPTDQKLTSILDEGSRLVQDQQLNRAIDVFTEAIELDPTWAEAWNKRATVFYMVGEFQKSQDDIDKVLELEERHFGALAGQGMVNIKLKNYDKAKRSYQKAQEIYPAMKSSKVMIEQIEELIKRQSI
ncbi:tetratricopeptide repeat protein [Candidatus Pelagibacter bacterium]|nr:tetratricopeptide repeat protein [Candidatus Pelagibacter bacterium]